MEPQGTGLMLPATYDIVWSVAALAALVLFCFALVRWTKVEFSSGSLSLLWLVVIVFVPIFGAASFLGYSRSLPLRAKALAQN